MFMSYGLHQASLSLIFKANWTTADYNLIPLYRVVTLEKNVLIYCALFLLSWLL